MRLPGVRERVEGRCGGALPPAAARPGEPGGRRPADLAWRLGAGAGAGAREVREDTENSCLMSARCLGSHTVNTRPARGHGAARWKYVLLQTVTLHIVPPASQLGLEIYPVQEFFLQKLFFIFYCQHFKCNSIGMKLQVWELQVSFSLIFSADLCTSAVSLREHQK